MSKKVLKTILWFLIFVILLFTFVYYVAISRADETSDENKSGIEGTNIDLVLDYIKDFLTSNQESYSSNTANVSDSTSLTQEEEDLINENELNRKLLDECLAKAENEWVKLQLHYQTVLGACVDLNLGLNGEKLFSTEECEYQINPFRTRDKTRIQNDKNDCFARYSERQ